MTPTRIAPVLAALLAAAAPARAQEPVRVRAGDPIVDASRVQARTDTFAMTFESGGTAVLVIRTALAGDAASPTLLRVERIQALTGRELSVDSFAARRPTLLPVFDVERSGGNSRTLLFPPGAVTGKKVRDGVRVAVNARLDPPAFYTNTTDVLLASLPLEQGREFQVAMWDPDNGPYTLRLHPAVAEMASTAEGGNCAAWRVDAEDRDGTATYWVERGSKTLLAYRAEGLELRIARHAACPPANGRREAR